LEEVRAVTVEGVVLNGVAYEDGAATTSSSSGVVGMIEHEIAKCVVAFVSEVGFRDEHDVNVKEGDEGFQFVHMVCQAVGVPQSEGRIEGIREALLAR
jgi:hypothetical protein